MSAQAPPPNIQPSKRRWRVRFSLRTLMLLVMTIASAGLLWWDWGPWRYGYTIKEDDWIDASIFSPNGKYIVTHTVRAAQDNSLNVYDAQTGYLIRRQQIDDLIVSRPFFSTGSNYYGIFVDRKDGDRSTLYFNAETGKALVINGTTKFQITQFSTHEHYLVYQTGSRYHLARFSKDNITDLHVFEHPVSLSPDEKWYVASYSYHAYDVGLVEGDKSSYKITAAGRQFRSPVFTPDSKTMFISGTTDDARPSQIGVSVTCFKLEQGTTLKVWQNKWYELCLSPDNKYFIVEGIRDTHAAIATIGEEILRPTTLSKIYSYSIDGKMIYGETTNADELVAFDTKTSKESFHIKRASYESDSDLIVASPDQKDLELYDSRDGSRLFSKNSVRERGLHRELARCEISAQRQLMLAESEDRRVLQIWNLVRPYKWWGGAWLPQFYLFILLFSALLWSIWRDRRV